MAGQVSWTLPDPHFQCSSERSLPARQGVAPKQSLVTLFFCLLPDQPFLGTAKITVEKQEALIVHVIRGGRWGRLLSRKAEDRVRLADSQHIPCSLSNMLHLGAATRAQLHLPFFPEVDLGTVQIGQHLSLCNKVQFSAISNNPFVLLKTSTEKVQMMKQKGSIFDGRSHGFGSIVQRPQVYLGWVCPAANQVESNLWAPGILQLVVFSMKRPRGLGSSACLSTDVSIHYSDVKGKHQIDRLTLTGRGCITLGTTWKLKNYPKRNGKIISVCNDFTTYVSDLPAAVKRVQDFGLIL